MSSSYMFPANLLTNTYVLHDFSEVAYIVCTGAIPANLDKGSNVQDANSRQRVLGRLKNAEQQFRLASILTILDVEKLELFTFYKKVDIVKDQKTILTKFGNVCKLNHCIIAYKNACQIAHLLKPEMSRVYKLFTSAVISSLQLHMPNNSEVIRINSQIFLVQSSDTISPEWSLTKRPRTQWFLKKADLQIAPNGHLLLAIRYANWPGLVAMTDLINPDVSPIDYSRGSTLYLVPTGQLARYKGHWCSSLSPELEEAMKPAVGANTLKYRSRWFQVVREWLIAKGEKNVSSQPGTIWLEVEIPVLAQPDDKESKVRKLVWKTVYWPASLSYAFSPINQRGVGIETFVADPFQVAREWFLEGATAARTRQMDRHNQTDHELGQADDRLFDDELHFGSPQQFMNLPMQTFANAQTVYPTPPEAMNTQPTPGMSIDGTVQTPATVPNIPTNNFNSSPLATMTDGGSVLMNEQAISNFLEHNDNDDNEENDDDLFDDIEEEKLGPNPFAGEPDWDFFNAENMDSSTKRKAVETVADTQLSSEKAHESVDHDNEHSKLLDASEAKTMEATETVPVIAEVEQREPQSENAKDDNIAKKESPPYRSSEDNRIIESDFSQQTPDIYGVHPPTSQAENSNKRRRSSAYDIVPAHEVRRDTKYFTSGKYWFELKKPQLQSLKKYPVPVPSSLRRPSSSSSSNSSSPSQTPNVPEEDEEEQQQPPKSKLQPWAEYDFDASAKQPDAKGDNIFDMTECDSEIQALLDLIASASGLEPFMLANSTSKVGTDTVQEIQENYPMVIQVLTEQLTQSSLLRNHEALRLPETPSNVPFEVSVDSAGSNTTLTSASLGDLAAIQTTNAHNKVNSKITTLQHSKVRLKQADNLIAAELSITKFWEILNLQPFSGSKNVSALCLHPRGGNYEQGSESFLQRIGETWSSCNLGTHQTIKLENQSTPGLAQWSTFDDLNSVCERIGAWLAAIESDDCTIVYMIIPDDDLTQCLRLCDAFVQLFEALDQSRESGTGDIALQLIPSSFIIGKDSIVIPTEEQYMNLAMEIYHRIPLPANIPDSADATLCAPAVTIEPPIAHNLHFELTATTLSPLAKYGQCCHLAYCFSVDRKWLVATWSDTIGCLSISMPYNLLGEQGNVMYSRLEVFRHLCETSAEIMNRQRRKWWLAIVKVGIFDTDELQDWSTVTNKLIEEQSLMSRVVLLNIELQSRLVLQNQALPSKQFQTLSQHTQNTLNTPVTTPQAVSTTSPDQTVPVTPTTASAFAANAQTPPDQNNEPGNEGDTFLTDPSEDSWMMTLSFGLNQSHTFLEIRPALATGFLLKRMIQQGNTGTQLAILSISWVDVPRKQSTTSPITPQEREQLLDEVLVQYRGLHTLAVARQCIEEQGNCVPWHVATAYKGARALEKLL